MNIRIDERNNKRECLWKITVMSRCHFYFSGVRYGKRQSLGTTSRRIVTIWNRYILSHSSLMSYVTYGREQLREPRCWVVTWNVDWHVEVIAGYCFTQEAGFHSYFDVILTVRWSFYADLREVVKLVKAETFDWATRVLWWTRVSYVFFWVFPRRPIVVCRCFGTLYQFHLLGLDVEYTLHPALTKHGESLKSRTRVLPAYLL